MACLGPKIGKPQEQQPSNYTRHSPNPALFIGNRSMENVRVARLILTVRTIVDQLQTAERIVMVSLIALIIPTWQRADRMGNA